MGSEMCIRDRDTVHVFDAGFTTFVEPVTNAALGHPEALGEYLLSDFEFTHLGLDQFNPFIHVRHDTWTTPAIKTQIVVFKLSSQIQFVL